MMAMTYQQADVDSASMAPTEEEEEEGEEEGEPGFERASHSFRPTGQGVSDAPKTPLHSGLSALIEAATAQLSGLEEGESGTGGADGHHNNHRKAASASFHLGSSSQVGGDHDTPTLASNSGRGRTAGTPSTGSSSLSTPRFTSHGFHTSVTNTITSTSNDCEAAAALLGSPSLFTTPPLGPEAAVNNAATAGTQDVRQQTFPEILMTLLEDKTNVNVIAFLPDGKFFAVRRKEFSETAMMNYFSVITFEEFLKKIHSWGFSRIIDHQRVASSNDHAAGTSEQQPSYRSGIEIFRHPMFIKGDWEKCSRICFGESPTDVRLSALPDRARIEYTLNDEATLTTSKRRLSPSHTASEISLPKQRLIFSSGIKPPLHQPTAMDGGGNGDQIPSISKIDSNDTSSTDASAARDATHNHIIKSNGLHNDPQQLDHSSSSEMIVTCKTSRSNSVVSYTNKTEDDDVRSLALAITTEKLNLKTPDDCEEHEEASTPLVERAVENATHTIVTDAIETLLRDDDHSRETYLKHEKELGRSSLPGVVPITKQLFSTPRSPTAADLEAAEALAISSSSLAAKCSGEQSPEEQKPDSSESDVVVVAGMDVGMKTRSRSSRGLQSPGLKTTELEEKGVAVSITSISN